MIRIPSCTHPINQHRTSKRIPMLGKFLSGISSALLFSLAFFLTQPVSGQLNIVLQDSMSYNATLNDVCGWVAPDGREYALVGLSSGVSIVDIQEDIIHEVAFVPGANNFWRDINTYSHYAYVSSEAQIGLLIIDLQYLPDSVRTIVWMDSIPTEGNPVPFRKAHTLWTDQEDGLLLLNGTNLNNGGVVICDIATDPEKPAFLGYAPGIYSHDCYTRDSIIYSAEIYAGNLSMYDARNPSDVSLIAQVKTPTEFTHNVWLSDDSRYMFTTDERPDSYVAAYDISDLDNIIELDRYRHAPTAGSGDIPHNVFVVEDWLVIAYYTNGITIVDASRPENLVEVGHYDTHLTAGTGFQGVWGAWPYLPSGKILASDIYNGVFVMEPTYVRACFLEGVVIDSVTRLPVANATITIEGDEIILPEISRINGEFKTGKAIPGTYAVRVSRSGYFDKVLELDFVNGEVLMPLVELVPWETYTITGDVVDENGNGVAFATVVFERDTEIFEVVCDNFGSFTITSLLGGAYEVQAGVWGQVYEGTIDVTSSDHILLEVISGYYDDFDLDLGWTISGDAVTGIWSRGLPQEQYLFGDLICSSPEDSPLDNGQHVYSTGLSQNPDVFSDEVNGGYTMLASPPMDFTTFVNPEISVDIWVCELPTPSGENGLSLWLTNGTDTLLLDRITNTEIAGNWFTNTYSSFALPEPHDQVQFLVKAQDDTPGLYVLKAHIDRFTASDRGISGVGDIKSIAEMEVYPNPYAGGELHFKLPVANEQLKHVQIIDIHGRVVSNYTIPAGQGSILLNNTITNGIYIARWTTVNGTTGVGRFLVAR